MAILLPDADAAAGGFINEGGGLSLFPSLADASDATFARSPSDPAGAIFRVRLSDPGGMPALPAFVRYRIKKDVSAAQQIDAAVRLLQGTTIIAEWDHLNISATVTEFEQQITTDEFQAVSDFNDLFLEFEFGTIINFTGILTVSEASDTIVAAAVIQIGVVVAVTEASDTLAAAAQLQLLASLVRTEANDTLLAAADIGQGTPSASLIFVGAGDPRTGNNIALTPLLPGPDHFDIVGTLDDMPFELTATVTPDPDTAVREGDYILAFHTQRSTVATSITIPADYTHVPGSPYPHATAPLVAAIAGKFSVGSGVAPAFSIAAGVENTPTIAQTAVFRGVDAATPISVTSFYQSSAQQNDIGPIPGVTLAAGDIVVVWGLKGGDWINVPDLSGNGLTFNEIGEPDVVLDVSGGFVWSWAKAATAVTVTAKTFQPSGGTQTVGSSIGGMLVLRQATAGSAIFASVSKTEANDTLVGIGLQGSGGLPLVQAKGTNHQFLSRIGVNLRLDWSNTYQSPAYTWRCLEYLSAGSAAFRRVRNAPPKWADAPLIVYRFTDLNDLSNAAGATRKLRWCFTSGGKLESQLNVNDYVADIETWVTTESNLEIIEGVNEPPVRTNYNVWEGVVRNPASIAWELAQDYLYDRIKSRPVLTSYGIVHFSQGQSGIHAAIDSDYWNYHPYPNIGQGENAGIHMPAYIRNKMDSEGFSETVGTGRAAFFTECGFHTQRQAGTGANGTGGYDTEHQAIFNEIACFEQFEGGCQGYYIYDLWDVALNPDDLQQAWGLFFYNPGVTTSTSDPAVTPKPAATMFRNQSLILADTNLSFTPANLNYRITGLPATGRSMLLQRSDGHHFILIWSREWMWTWLVVPPLNGTTTDPGGNTGVPRTVTPAPLTLEVPPGMTVRWYCPCDSASFGATPTLTKKPLIAEVF